MITAHDPEILVLSEFRNNAAGTNLRQWLHGFGHQHQAVPETAEPRDNTVLVPSRSAFQRMTFPELKLNAHRCVGASIPWTDPSWSLFSYYGGQATGLRFSQSTAA